MASTNVTIPVSRFTRDMQMTITVSGLKIMRARFWLGTQIIRLAVAVMGIGGADVRLEK